MSRKHFIGQILVLTILLFSFSVSANQLSITSSTNSILEFGDKNPCPRKQKDCSGAITYKDGVTYEGDFSYGLPHGYGLMTWPNGDTYEGPFIDGLRHGEGEQVYANGDVYQGEFKFGMMNGKGVYLWKNSAKYKGEFYNDLIHGDGFFADANGETYEGEWQNGLAHGEGVYSLIDGSKYLGKFKDGRRHGSGVITWRNGVVLNAKWKDGRLHGNMAVYFENDDQYTADWRRGKLNGTPVYQSSQQKMEGSPFHLNNTIQADETLKESMSENVAMLYYILALEDKTNKEYDECLAILTKAKSLIPASSILGQLIHEQIEIVEAIPEGSIF